MAIVHLGAKRLQGTKADRKSDSLGSSADGTNTGITLSGLGNTAANDVSHFEESSGILNKIIGEKITSGNEIIGRTVTKLGFKLYRMDSGTFSSSDTLTFGVWDNATGDLKTSGSFGTVRIDSLEYNSASNVSHCKEVSLTHSGSGVTIAENDIIGVRIDIDNASAKRVEVAQHDTGSPYANGGRCIFDQGDDNPSFTAGKDIWFRVYQGKLGTGAYSFNGSSSKVALGSTTDWSFLSQADAKWTITGWYSADNFSSNQVLVGSSDFGTNDAGIMIRLNTDRTFRIILGKDSTDRISHITTLTTPNDTDWHFLCVQYDDSIGTLSISVDGGSVETDTGNNLTNTTTPDNPLQLGWNGHSLYFDGKLDDWSVWKRELTATEIGKLANNNNSPIVEFGTADDNSMAVYLARRGGQRVTDTSLRNISITKVVARLFSYNSTNGSATLVCRIRKLSDDSIVATSSTIPLSNLTGNGGNVSDATDQTFTFSNVTTPNEDYQILIEGSTTSNITGSNPCYVAKQTSITSNKGYESYYNSSYAYDTGKEATFDVTYPSTGGDAQLVSSLSDKANLKAYYSMDSTTLEALKNTPDYTFNFSSDTDWDRVGSGTSNTVYIDTSAGHIRHNTTTNTSSMKKVYYDLTDYTSGSAVNDSKWTMRFKWVVTNQSAPSSWLMALSGNTTDPDSASWNGIGVHLNDGNGSMGYHITTCDGSTKTMSSNVTTPSNSQTLYVELARTSATKAKLTMWSDSYGGTEVGTSQELTIPSGVTSLKYLQSGSGQGGNSSRTMNATLDDLEIFDDSIQLDGCANDHSSTSDLDAYTNLPTNTIFEQTDDTPSYWWYNGTSWVLDGTTQNEPSLTSSTNWLPTNNSSSDKITLDTTAGEVDYIGTRDGNWNSLTYDLGSALSNTAWVVRARINITSISAGNAAWFIFGMSKVPSSTDISGEGSGSTTDSCLGFIMYESSNKRFGLAGGNDRKAVVNNIGFDTLDFTPAEQYYYVELKRTSDANATFTIYDDSTFTTVKQTKTNTGNLAGASDLQYLGFYNMKDTATGGAFVVEVDQIQIQDGRSTWLE